MTVVPDGKSFDPEIRANSAGWVKEQPLPGNKLSKRLFDITLALVLLVPLGIVMIVVACIMLIRQGRPILYTAPRMQTPTRSFRLYKFRTMKCVEHDSGASGAHKRWRITKMGHVLRRTRIDELPQLFNILKGDLSFVGPRPPLREYVERFPVMYGRVLASRPGVTGLATLVYHEHEDRILDRCKTAEETERAYFQRCVPTKLRLDMIYQQKRTMALDLWIIWNTVMTVFYPTWSWKGGRGQPDAKPAKGSKG